MRRRPPFHLMLATSALLASCSSPDNPNDSKSGAIVLNIGNLGEPKALDPHIVTGIVEERILSSLFEGLVNLDLRTLEPIPGVAETWELSPDGRVYTFRLRGDARWSNGDPVTAGDFVYAWRRILTPGLAAEYAYLLYPIVNAEAYNTGTLSGFDAVGVKALDDRTLTVTLRAPTPYFLSMQIHFPWYPIHQKTIETHGAIDTRDTPWTRPGNLVGNGPYALAAWTPNDTISVVRNPNYWDAGRVKIDEVRFHAVSSAIVEERMFRAGELDLTYTAPLTKIAAYRENEPELIRIDPYLATEFIRFNITRAPFDDIRVRRAFSLAIDRQRLVDHVLKGGQRPASAFTPPDTAGYTGPDGPRYDPEQARALLAEAGYPEGKGFPTVEFLYDTGDNQRIYSETLQSMWKTELGIEVSLVNQDVKTWLASLIGLNYRFARSYWVGDYVDPSNFLEMFYGNSGNNRTGFRSDEYEALLRRAAATLDASERNDTFRRAETILLDSAAIAPIYYWTRPYLASPRVKGLHANVLGRIAFKELDLTPAAAPGL